MLTSRTGAKSLTVLPGGSDIKIYLGQIIKHHT